MTDGIADERQPLQNEPATEPAARDRDQGPHQDREGRIVDAGGAPQRQQIPMHIKGRNEGIHEQQSTIVIDISDLIRYSVFAVRASSTDDLSYRSSNSRTSSGVSKCSISSA